MTRRDGILRATIAVGVLVTFAESVVSASQERSTVGRTTTMVVLAVAAALSYGFVRPCGSSLRRAALATFAIVVAAELTTRLIGTLDDGAIGASIGIVYLPIILLLVAAGTAIRRHTTTRQRAADRPEHSNDVVASRARTER
ncbi:MAG: hypothetical protein WKF96_23215 [Solirubrobacteraceae bacterium]